jgi:hypothetical protein
VADAVHYVRSHRTPRPRQDVIVLDPVGRSPDVVHGDSCVNIYHQRNLFLPPLNSLLTLRDRGLRPGPLG